jgi:hypothetical protein
MGLSADAVDTAGWKSCAQGAMEESGGGGEATDFIAGARAYEESTASAPANFAWIQTSGKKQTHMKHDFFCYVF